MRVNRFFSSVIRIQTDRGHHVVTTGPYAFVRHPGYIAGILIILASGPALGSWLAVCAHCDFQPAISALSDNHGGSNSPARACRLFGLRRAGPMAARPGHLVRATPRLGRHAPHQTVVTVSERGKLVVS
ncbi:methyltransferase family protein [Bradyrhizobium sp. USDA 4529]